MKIIKHIIIVIVILFILLGIPAILYADIPSLFDEEADATSSATLDIPDKPSGNFVVYLNKNMHPETFEQWGIFFNDSDAGVIMDDIECMVINSDISALEYADRFKMRLAENQMNIKLEDSLMLSSKLECGMFDVIIASKEFSDANMLDTVQNNNDINIIEIKG